jgi:hypothetical protein
MYEAMASTVVPYRSMLRHTDTSGVALPFKTFRLTTGPSLYDTRSTFYGVRQVGEGASATVLVAALAEITRL